MIKFDNLRVSNRKTSLDLTEAVEFVAGVSMIFDIGYHWYAPLFEVMSGSWASVSHSEASVVYTGSGEVAIADVDGSVLFETNLSSGVGVWLTATDYRIGVEFGDNELVFYEDADVVERIDATPVFDVPFRVLYTVELDSNLTPVYLALSVYNASSLMGTHVFASTIEANSVCITATSESSVGISIKEINRPTTYLTIDVSEAPQESLARLTNGLPVSYYGRYDGSVFVRRSGVERDPVCDITEYHRLASAVSETVKMSDVVNRARVSGALPEGEQVDLDSVDKYLLKFDVFQNPEILSQRDAIAEAGRLLRRNYRDNNVVTLDWHTLPILEHGDIVLIDGERYIFNQMSFEFLVGIPGSVTLMKEKQ